MVTVDILVKQSITKGEWIYLFPLEALSASVAITVPRVNKLESSSEGVRCKMGRGYLVLMYFPSFVRSLSEVALSEPAKSIKD